MCDTNIYISYSTSNHQHNTQVERIEFTPGRGNLIVKYPGSTDKSMAFVGSHLDVVRVGLSKCI